MIAFKDMEEIPSCCVAYDSGNDNYTSCPFYKICKQRETIKTNYKPDDCPLVEIVTCKDCKHRTESTCLKHRHFIYDSFYCKEGERE